MDDRTGAWTKRFSRIVDQRDYRLPPTWVPRSRRRAGQSEIGPNVHVSGRERALAGRIVSLLAEAREKVVLSSFLLADRKVEDAILDAAGRKVRVYVLLASEARLDIEDSDGEFEQSMRDQHEEMLTRLGGHALFRSAPHFHAKIVLADPGGDDGAGLLLTANLTKEALERNEELAVELTRDEVGAAFELLRWAFWENAEHELVDPMDRFRPVKPLGSVGHPEPSLRVPATTSESRELLAEATRLVEAASGELVVSSFGWDKDHEIVEFLCVRAREGLDVTALARVRESQMPALLALAKSGGCVLGFKWLHAKALCADGDKALVMSANLQPDGLDRGFELGVSVDGERAEEIHGRLAGWSGTARWELLASPTLGDISGEARVWRGNRLDDMAVEDERRIDLGAVTAESADRLDDAAAPDIPPADGLPEPAHRVVYEWSVRAPILDAKAKPITKPPEGESGKPVAYDPPVFKGPNGRLVVAVVSEREIPKAREVAASAGAAAIVVRTQTARQP